MLTTMKKCLVRFLILGFLLGTSNAALAHHSVFPYDMRNFLELEGTITEVLWRNPHIRLKIAAEDDTGASVEWELEGDSTNAAMRRGLTRDSIHVGDQVRVAGNPSNRGLQRMLVTHILLPNGEEHLVHERPRPLRWTAESASEPQAPTADRSLFRVWSSGSSHRPREPFVYTAAAERARAAWNADTDMLALRCIAPGMPNAILNPYPIEFIDEGDQIRLRIEQWNATLMIDMVSDQVPADAVPSIHGYALGAWNGDTLVVTTSHIDFPYVDDEGTPLSADAVITERFTVSDDGNQLLHELTVTDPANFVEPAVVAGTWGWVPGIEVGNFECEPE
jgi:hypothetical protein